MSEKLEELISLLYQDRLTQCGKRLLVENIEKLQKENEELKADNYELNNRTIDLLENIPVQKVKDKIKILEKLQNEFLNNEELRVKIIAYKELIEERSDIYENM